MLEIENEFNIGDKVTFPLQQAWQQDVPMCGLGYKTGYVGRMEIQVWHDNSYYIIYTIEVDGEITSYQVRDCFLKKWEE